MNLLKPPLKVLLTALVSCVVLCSVSGQNILHGPFTFSDISLDNWLLNGNVRYVADGTAATVDPNFWDTRSRILSTSLGGAAVLWAEDDGLPTPFAAFRSPLSANLNFSGEPNVYMSFHQYYRNYTAAVRVNVYEDGGFLGSVSLNDSIGGNVETSRSDTVILDLSAIINQRDNIQVEFELTGHAYFWLIDDVTFYDAIPYPQTIPATMGNYLAQQNYPYEVEEINNVNDNGATAYVPLELVVQFAAGVTDMEKQDLRDTLGAEKIDDCVCGTLELWRIDGSDFFDPTGQSPAGGTIDILTNKDGAGEKPKIDNVDLNYYNGVELMPMPPLTVDTLTPDSTAGLNTSNPNAYKIAIIDTGLDYQHPEIRDYVARKPDSACYENDPIGWNFVDGNNNPFDDQSHGTHVAGIIIDSLNKYETLCDYELIPYKAHDRNGISTLFRVSCATYQAVKDDVDIINDSWGFFGDPSPILRAAMDTAIAANVLISTAAGNDGIMLDTMMQYPACFEYGGSGSPDSIITVGATDSLAVDEMGILAPTHAAFSNFSSVYVDILAPGVQVESTVPRWMDPTDTIPRGIKSGTSMATPAVTAAAAIAHCCNNLDSDATNNEIWAAKDTILSNWAVPYPSLGSFGRLGRFLDYQPDPSCLVGVDNIIDVLTDANGYQAFPNPTDGKLWLSAIQERGPSVVNLVNASGQRIYQWQSAKWYPEQKQEINLEGVPAGMYYLQVVGADYLWVGKIIKM